MTFVNRSAERLLAWDEEKQNLAIAVAVPEFGTLFDQLRAGVSDIPNDGPLESWIEGLLAAVPGTMDDDLTVVALRRTGLTTHDSDPSTTMDTP